LQAVPKLTGVKGEWSQDDKPRLFLRMERQRAGVKVLHLFHPLMLTVWPAMPRALTPAARPCSLSSLCSSFTVSANPAPPRG